MLTDRYYTNYTNYILANLPKLKCHLTDTILTNRKKLPDSIKKSMIAYIIGNNNNLAGIII